ncbi:MAG TPA: type II toxin-antitoxin system RelE/ParE family toxin [Clostridia bacterium]|nr:type II toxin-antitoxin system RelE/ParE family toxin [Clostridia bacterium]
MNKLKISPEAGNDLVEIKNYISQELYNPQSAENLISKITKRIRDLLDYPEIGAPLASVIDIHTDYRFLVCDNYLIFYRYEDGVVYVIRILYGRQDYMHVLFNDLS